MSEFKSAPRIIRPSGSRAASTLRFNRPKVKIVMECVFIVRGKVQAAKDGVFQKVGRMAEQNTFSLNCNRMYKVNEHIIDQMTGDSKGTNSWATLNCKGEPAMILKLHYCPGAFPVTGSVPRALLNKRMCGSGLRNYERVLLGEERDAASLVNGIVIPSTALLHT